MTPAVGNFGHAALDVLSRQPLPESRSDDAGQFVLPLTPDQRVLGCLQEPSGTGCLVVVEKEGFAPWVEGVRLDTAAARA